MATGGHRTFGEHGYWQGGQYVPSRQPARKPRLAWHELRAGMRVVSNGQHGTVVWCERSGQWKIAFDGDDRPPTFAGLCVDLRADPDAGVDDGAIEAHDAEDTV